MATNSSPCRFGPDNGHLVLVVGPSGAGKDSLIDIARAMLERDARFVFPTRLITREADGNGERHVQITQAGFEQMANAGAFFLSWKANGHCYGLPANIRDHLAEGRTVIANVSRMVVDEAKDKTPRVSIVHVTAPKDVVESRLHRRKRECPTEIRQRLDRYETDAPLPADAMTIDTRDPTEQGLRSAAERFVHFLDAAGVPPAAGGLTLR